MNQAVSNWKQKAQANPKVQEIQSNEKFQLALKHGPLAYRVLVLLLFVIPLISLQLGSSCYAMDRPDFFWPVKESTQDVEFSVTDMSSKFQFIFFLGFLTHIAHMAVEHLENQAMAPPTKSSKARSQQDQQKEEEEDEKLKKNIRVVKVVIFALKILFLLWIISARYGHTGRVCSGDYNGNEDLRLNSNWNKKLTYTYDNFSGFVLKLYVWVFLVKLFVTSSIALWLGTSWDPADDDDEDDNYNRQSPSRFNDNERGSTGVVRSPSPVRQSSPDNHAQTFSPDSNKWPEFGNSPSRGLNQKKNSIKGKETDYERKVREQMERTMQAKLANKQFIGDQQKRGSSKKALQKQMNNIKK